MAYEVIDNFLSQENHRIIADAMLGGDFPWYYNDHIVAPNEGDSVYNYQFTHTFYADHSWNSEFGRLLTSLVDAIQPKAIIRIKANLNPVTDNIIDGGWHTDYAFACKTAVYYVNTNNGYTRFKSNQIVESVANRLVIFDSHDLHTGSTTTDTKARCVINLNYL